MYKILLIFIIFEIELLILLPFIIYGNLFIFNLLFFISILIILYIYKLINKIENPFIYKNKEIIIIINIII